MQGVRLSITLSVEAEVTPDHGHNAAPMTLDANFHFGLHGGVRHFSANMALLNTPFPTPRIHYREIDLESLNTNALYILICVFDNQNWFGSPLLPSGATNSRRHWVIWLNRPEVSFFGDHLDPPETGVVSRATSFLDEDVNEYLLDGGPLANAGYPDMGMIFPLGDYAMLGIRPGVSRLKLTTALHTTGLNETAKDANFYLLELDRVEQDLVNLYGRNV